MAALKWIPNSLTLLNLLFGIIGIWVAYNGEWKYLLLLGSLSLVFDFLDGFLAKRLHATSAIGKELDSLSDVVSFGVQPSIILQMLFLKMGGELNVSFLFFFMALFASYRLAKFNVDTNQSTNFLGIPTPAVLVFVLGLVNSYLNQDQLSQFITTNSLLIMTAVLSILMVAPVKMMAFKNLSESYKDVFFILFLVLSISSLVIWGISGFVPIIFAYIIISLIKFYVYRNNLDEIQS